MWDLTPMKEGFWPAWRRRPCGRLGRPAVSDEAPSVPGICIDSAAKGLTGMILATIKFGPAWPGCPRPWGGIDRSPAGHRGLDP